MTPALMMIVAFDLFLQQVHYDTPLLVMLYSPRYYYVCSFDGLDTVH